MLLTFFEMCRFLCWLKAVRFFCPVIHLMNRNKLECTAKAKGCMYVLCWIWGSSLSSLTREAAPAEQFPYCLWYQCQNTVENSAPRVLHYHVFAPRRMNSLHLFIVHSFFLHNVTQISGSEAELPHLLLNWQSHTCAQCPLRRGAHLLAQSPQHMLAPAMQGLSCQQIQSSERTPNGDILPCGIFSFSWIFLLEGSECNMIGLVLYSHMDWCWLSALEGRPCHALQAGFLGRVSSSWPTL